MAALLRHHSTIARWTLALSGMVLLLVLSRFSYLATEHPPVLGVRAAASPGGLTITWVRPAALAWDAGVRPGDQVRAIDGNPVTTQATADDVRQAQAIQVQTPAGQRIDAAVDTAQTVARQRRWSFLVLAMAFAAVGSAVWILGADLLVAGMTWFMMLAAAVALIAATATSFGAGWALATEFIALLAFGVSTLAFFLVFPVNQLGAVWARQALRSAVGVSLGLAVTYLGVVALDSGGYAVLQRVFFLVLALELGGAALLALRSVVRPSPAQRTAQRALALIALGATAGLLPFCVLVLIPRLVGSQAVLRPELAILGLILLPASVGNAMVSKQFPGITRLVRRSSVALVVWAVLIGVASLGFVWVARWEALYAGAQVIDLTTSVVLVTILVAGFWPIQAFLRRVLERRLFHDVYDYRGTLHELSGEIAHLTELEAIASHILRRVGKILDLTWGCIRLDSIPESFAFDWDVRKGVVSGRGESIPLDPYARVIPLVVNDEPVGELVVGGKRHDVEHTPEDLELLATLAPLFATALQNALLVRQLEEQVVRMTEREAELAHLSGRLLQIQEEERRMIALDIHDDALQRSILLARELKAAKESHEFTHLGQWTDMADDITESLRAVCTGLRPSVLDDLGLAAGLEWLVTQYRANTDLAVNLVVDGGSGDRCDGLDHKLGIALYRVAQEALNNCVNHARASTVSIDVHRKMGRLTLTVADDGRGLDDSAVDPHGQGIGLIGMQERLKPWGGKVRFSRREPHGLRVSVEIPGV